MKENFMRELLLEHVVLVAGADPATYDGGDNGGANYDHIESHTTNANGVEYTVVNAWNDPAPGELPYPDEYWYPR
jgi:hypothetical protein